MPLVLVEVLLYAHRNRRLIRDVEPRTATSTFTQLLSSGWYCHLQSLKTAPVLPLAVAATVSRVLSSKICRWNCHLESIETAPVMPLAVTATISRVLSSKICRWNCHLESSGLQL